MKCPFETPVRVIESNGSIVDAKNDMVVKVLYSHKNFSLQVKQLHYTAKAINSHEKLLENLNNLDNCLAIMANTKTEEGIRDLPSLSNNLRDYIKQALKEAEKE